MTLILVPLIMTTFGRVDTIANAMDLRRFGNLKKRTWYSHNPPTRADWIVRVLVALTALVCVYYIIQYRIIHPAPYEYWCPWV
jgi:energy-coupling factor transport system permease protein